MRACFYQSAARELEKSCAGGRICADVLCVLEFIMLEVIKRRKKENQRLVGSTLRIYACEALEREKGRGEGEKGYDIMAI